MMSKVYFRTIGPFSPETNQGNEQEEENKKNQKVDG